MKKIFFTALVASLIFGCAAKTKPVGSDSQEAPAPATVAAARRTPTIPEPNPLREENPTGLPEYELRPDGLLINGLLPANGWAG